jgi:hypothetical protein
LGRRLRGAIVKNKLFYFVAFERYMQSMWGLGANSRTVPTDAMMGLNANGSVAQYADLSNQLPKASNGNPIPMGTDSCGNTYYQGNVFNPSTNCAFVMNHIPTNMISTTTAKVLQLFHQDYQPQATSNINDPGPAYQPDPWFHNTQSSVKIDYNMSSKQHINKPAIPVTTKAVQRAPSIGTTAINLFCRR